VRIRASTVPTNWRAGARGDSPDGAAARRAEKREAHECDDAPIFMTFPPSGRSMAYTSSTCELVAKDTKASYVDTSV
jgi:hypothetical protein